MIMIVRAVICLNMKIQEPKALCVMRIAGEPNAIFHYERNLHNITFT